MIPYPSKKFIPRASLPTLKTVCLVTESSGIGGPLNTLRDERQLVQVLGLPMNTILPFMLVNLAKVFPSSIKWVLPS